LDVVHEVETPVAGGDAPSAPRAHAAHRVDVAVDDVQGDGHPRWTVLASVPLAYHEYLVVDRLTLVNKNATAATFNVIWWMAPRFTGADGFPASSLGAFTAGSAWRADALHVAATSSLVVQEPRPLYGCGYSTRYVSGDHLADAKRARLDQHLYFIVAVDASYNAPTEHYSVSLHGTKWGYDPTYPRGRYM
jgi:hypothetical protein